MSTATFSVPYHRDDRVVRPRTVRAVQATERQSTSSAGGRTGSVRLTRRGRLVILLAVLAMAFAAFTLLGGPAVSTGQTHHAAQHTVVVGGGETLWDIASRIAPDEDPRSVIADIVDLNALSDAGSIRVGQKLYVPAY